MHEKNLALMDSILSGIECSEEWEEILQSDQRVCSADARLLASLRTLSGVIPDKLYNELCDASASCASAYSDVGILYGMHVAFAILDVVGNVPAMSRYIMERMRKEASA